MEYMKILMHQLELDHLSDFDAYTLKKVKVHQNGEYTFTIGIKHLVPFDALKAIETHKDRFPYPCEFIFEYEEIDETNEDMPIYIQKVLQDLIEQIPEFHQYNFDQIEYKDHYVTIHCVNHVHLSLLEANKTEIEKHFSHYGLDVTLQLEIRENQVYETIEKEMAEVKVVKVEKQMIDSYKEETPKVNKPTNYASYKREYTGIKINEINSYTSDVLIEGYVFKVDEIVTKKGKLIQTLYVTDYTDSVMVKRFESARNPKEVLQEMGKGNKWVIINGKVEYDMYAREQTIIAHEVKIEEMPLKAPQARVDKAEKKRVELHMHSKMSTLDGVSTIESIVAQAKHFDHPAIAITDHGNVHAFPDAQAAASKAGIKMLYGVELNMIDPSFDSVFNEESLPLKDLTFISFDLETTGLSQIDDYITEFGATKFKNGLVVKQMQTFIKSPKPISPRITRLTGITNKDIENAPTIEEIMPQILEFFGDDLLVAHNGRFDIGMLNYALKRMNQPEIKNVWIDSLPLARHLIPLMRSYRLGAVCSYYHIPYDGEEAHRADYDAEVLGYAFAQMVEDLKRRNITNINEINAIPLEDDYKHAFGYHMIALAKNQTGLKNMFKIVSEANTTYFYRNDRIPRKRLEHYREGLLFGSACINSRVFEIAATRNLEELREEIKFYDYIEIHPLIDAKPYVDRGRFTSLDEVERIYKRIIQIAKEEEKIIVATGDAHYVYPHEKLYREVLISNPKISIGGRPHPLCDRNNAFASTPDCFLRTTDEMMQLFPYLTEEECYQYVVENTNLIADMIDDNIEVVKKGLYPPHIENVDEKFRNLCYDTAYKTYGNPLPKEVKERLDFEVENIIHHGYAVIYYISALLVHESNKDGYLVGSRGSVGSSFAATMSGISEVNPLPPHYHCPHCQHTEFVKSVANGFDLPDKKCPECGTYMKGDGHNIPFQTFLGFNGDKVPDIDLNFSGEYQPKAHEFVRKMFGNEHAFRAGTIATVAEKTAYGYAKIYSERIHEQFSKPELRKAELERLSIGCQGVKRTTGQHPAGIIVIPDDMEVFDFTPYQFPADDTDASWRTTHFDFHKIHDNVLKFDILGHVDPTVTRKLQDLTGVDPLKIPTNDPYVMSLFRTSEALNVDLSFIGCKTGALGLPEFGTKFVRGMLEATNPTSFSDLVIISGLSHGTDVYLGNAETLIKTGICTLSNVIGCRDDIMVYLIEKGLPNKDAFDIMEFTRKGKAAKVFPEKGYVELMKKHNVPDWYIESCLKIKYMFPKAHAAAYVYSALRIAWWKVYYPREYYAVYFSVRCDAYDIETMIQGFDAVKIRYDSILEKKNMGVEVTNKEEALITVFEVAMEMFKRGYHFNSIDLYKSDSSTFKLDNEDHFGIIPPFTSIDGLGESVGDSVIDARNEKEFTSLEDVSRRTKLSQTHIDVLKSMGVFDGLNASDQLSIFDDIFSI